MKALKEANINIRTLSLADTSDFGILRLIVNDVTATSTILKARGFRVSRTTVVAVEVPDRPGGLHSILEALGGEAINIEYLYAFVEKKAVKTPSSSSGTTIPTGPSKSFRRRDSPSSRERSSTPCKSAEAGPRFLRRRAEMNGEAVTTIIPRTACMTNTRKEVP